MRSKILTTLLLTLALAAAVPRAAAQTQPPPKPPAATDGFVSFESLPPQEQIPAARFLMTAYAVAWLAVFGYLWSIWQRLGRVEQDIAAISRRLQTDTRR